MNDVTRPTKLKSPVLSTIAARNTTAVVASTLINVGDLNGFRLAFALGGITDDVDIIVGAEKGFEFSFRQTSSSTFQSGIQM